MTKDKPFKTYEELVKKLKKDKGLTVNDESFAIKTLKQTSYFALISGYKQPYKNKEAGNKYYRGVRFEDILGLYAFDGSLRALFLNALLEFERNLKSLFSYYFAETYGDDESTYTDVTNYNYMEYQLEVNELVSILSATSNNMQYGYINHYRKKHKNLPIWVLVNALTFGNISKMYSLAKPELQSKISKNFNKINEDKLKSILEVITKYRNVCAHNERLYNYKTNTPIPDLEFHKVMLIPKENDQYTHGKNDLYAVYISLFYLLNRDKFVAFDKSLRTLFAGFKNSDNWLDISTLLCEMGFPYNWLELDFDNYFQIHSSSTI